MPLADDVTEFIGLSGIWASRIWNVPTKAKSIPVLAVLKRYKLLTVLLMI